MYFTVFKGLSTSIEPQQCHQWFMIVWQKEMNLNRILVSTIWKASMLPWTWSVINFQQCHKYWRKQKYYWYLCHYPTYYMNRPKVTTRTLGSALVLAQERHKSAGRYFCATWVKGLLAHGHEQALTLLQAPRRGKVALTKLNQHRGWQLCPILAPFWAAWASYSDLCHQFQWYRSE